LLLDGSQSDLLLSWTDGQLHFFLTAPNGHVINTSNVHRLLAGSIAQEPTTDSDPRLISYQLVNPPAGTWIATIAATDVLTETTLALFAAVRSPLQLSLDKSSSVDPGERFSLMVAISDTTSFIDGATVTARFGVAHGEQAITLVPTGSGMYTGQLTAPRDVGAYVLSVTAIGAPTNPFARQMDELIVVRAHGVQLQSEVTTIPIDHNGNRLIEMLRVTATFAATTAGDYAVLATLQDANGRIIALARSSVVWATGNNSLVLDFDGSDIVASGIDGPYQVVVQIISRDSAALVADEQPLVMGLDYRALDFEGSPFQLFFPLLRH
jgi:hypothetical protein